MKKKIRVDYDYSAKHKGVLLNDCLITGPDLITSIVGILIRFRKEPVVFMCDVTKMFPQFQVPENLRDCLRFLWWKDGEHYPASSTHADVSTSLWHSERDGVRQCRNEGNC